MTIAQHIYPLKGKVQHYSWGGYEYIPQLLSIDNTEKKPYSEYWLGAHPNHPSTILADGKEQSLNEFIQQNKRVLGAAQKKFQFATFFIEDFRCPSNAFHTGASGQSFGGNRLSQRKRTRHPTYGFLSQL